MSDGLRVRIVRDPRTESLDFVFLERVNGKTVFIWRPQPDGLWKREQLVEGSERRPSFSFPEDVGREVLQSFAEQLAQLGFVQLHSHPQIEAMQGHIGDLRLQAERLFTLAKRKR
jgi:hypothetical protein